MEKEIGSSFAIVVDDGDDLTRGLQVENSRIVIARMMIWFFKLILCMVFSLIVCYPYMQRRSWIFLGILFIGMRFFRELACVPASG